jgi:nitrite reductase/ring-hydroxylating ferredoxin subunit
MSFLPALCAEDLWEGELRGLSLGGHRVLLLRLPDGVRAYEDRCAHLGLPLSSGTLEGSTLTCGAHHYQYDARDGTGINPRCAALVALPTRIVDGMILVDLPRTLPGLERAEVPGD